MRTTVSHKSLDEDRRLKPSPQLWFRCYIGSEIFFRATDYSHEKNAFVRLHRTGPSLLLDVTPALEFLRLAGLRIASRRKQKHLHSFFRQTDLCNLTGFIIVKNPNTNRALSRKFRRHIVILEPVFHKKHIAP